jgi:ABC-2 type transport system permease protein
MARIIILALVVGCLALCVGCGQTGVGAISSSAPAASSASATAALPDGEYDLDVSLEGGSGRATIQSPAKLSELITIENRYNPTLNYRHYMIPALMIILFILICGFLPALSIVGEKESGTIEQINVTPISRFMFILSKLVPYWIIGLFVVTVAMLVARLVYGLAPVGSVGAIYFGALLFILTISGFSLTIANFSETMQQTMFVMFFFIMTFMLMSGLLTPIDSMPEWAQRFTLILPPRYFVEVLRSVYLKGTTVAELWTNYAALGISAIIFNTLAALTYKKQA